MLFRSAPSILKERPEPGQFMSTCQTMVPCMTIQSYLPIPTTLDITVTDQDSMHPGECYSKTYYVNASASLYVAGSTTPEYYTPSTVVEHRSAPTDGNWTDIKKSGQIKMTPMSASRVKTQNFLGNVTRQMSTYDTSWNGFSKSEVGDPPVCTTCERNDTIRAFAVANGSSSEQGDFSYWRDRYPSAPHYGVSEELDTAELERAKSSAFQELYQGFNLGEELYELTDTLKLIAGAIPRAASILRKLKPGGSGLSPKDLADNWLSIRYGMLPIMYSIQDAVKLLESEGKYRTARRSVDSNSEFDDIGDESTYFYDTGSITTTARVTAKGRWSSSSNKILDIINVNPFTTAATVYPWALVVRWFFNLNSAIDAYTKSFTSSALQVAGCVGVKSSSNVTTSMHTEYDSSWSYDYDGGYYCGVQGYFVGYSDSGGSAQTFDVQLRKVESDTYVRTLFSPTDVKIVFDPVITLTRLMDGLAFLTQSNTRLLRGL